MIYWVILLIPAILLGAFSTINHLNHVDVDLHMKVLLLFIKVLHMYFGLYLTTYLLVFNQEHDVEYLIAYIVMIGSWLIFKKECIMNYFEIIIVDPSYELGSDPYKLTREFKSLYTLLHVWFYLTAVFVIYRIASRWSRTRSIMSTITSTITKSRTKSNTGSITSTLVALVVIIPLTLNLHNFITQMNAKEIKL
jgi:hypothetical protein